MKRSKLVSMVFAGAVLLIAGCSDDSGSTVSSTSSSTPTTSATSSSAATSSSSTAAPAATTLAVATNSSLGKQILVDGSGKTVYLYEPDGTNATSQVPSGLKALWPAVPATAAPTVSTELDSSKVAAQPQPDGSMQVAYNGHLLYTFQNDTAPGDAKGQGLGDIWYTLTPAGDKNE